MMRNLPKKSATILQPMKPKTAPTKGFTDLENERQDIMIQNQNNYSDFSFDM
jgi:hypothetical protein